MAWHELTVSTSLAAEAPWVEKVGKEVKGKGLLSPKGVPLFLGREPCVAVKPSVHSVLPPWHWLQTS